jgi:hypothetical protein
LNGKGNLWGADGMKMAVARFLIVGSAAQNTQIGRNWAIRSRGIGDGRPANGFTSIE